MPGPLAQKSGLVCEGIAGVRECLVGVCEGLVVNTLDLFLLILGVSGCTRGRTRWLITISCAEIACTRQLRQLSVREARLRASDPLT